MLPKIIHEFVLTFNCSLAHSHLFETTVPFSETAKSRNPENFKTTSKLSLTLTHTHTHTQEWCISLLYIGGSIPEIDYLKCCSNQML